MKPVLKLFLVVLLIVSTHTSCVPYRVPTKDLELGKPESTLTDHELVIRQEARQHPIYSLIPRHRSQVHPLDFPRWVTWGLMGNDDDGLFGEEPSAKYTKGGKISLQRALNWGLRNPLHNFTFYVIGSAQFENSEYLLLTLSSSNFEVFSYRKKARRVFASDRGSSILLSLHGWKPFLSLRLDFGRKFEFYCGWRERGNFGLKIIPFKN